MPIVFNRLPEIQAKARPLVGMALRKAAFDITSRAMSIAPVDTGNLRGSIVPTKQGTFSWRITAQAGYALYVELGTRKMSAQPFLVPALNSGFFELVRVVRRLV